MAEPMPSTSTINCTCSNIANGAVLCLACTNAYHASVGLLLPGLYHQMEASASISNHYYHQQQQQSSTAAIASTVTPFNTPSKTPIATPRYTEIPSLDGKTEAVRLTSAPTSPAKPPLSPDNYITPTNKRTNVLIAPDAPKRDSGLPRPLVLRRSLVFD